MRPQDSKFATYPSWRSIFFSSPSFPEEGEVKQHAALEINKQVNAVLQRIGSAAIDCSDLLGACLPEFLLWPIVVPPCRRRKVQIKQDIKCLERNPKVHQSGVGCGALSALHTLDPFAKGKIVWKQMAVNGIISLHVYRLKINNNFWWGFWLRIYFYFSATTALPFASSVICKALKIFKYH